MRQRLSLIVVLGLIMMAQTFISCRHYVGCKQYENITVEATYCRLHREAVWDYVELTDTEAGQKGRSYSMVRLVEELNRCNSMECVQTEIAADTIAAGFQAIYSSVHRKAEGKLYGATIETRKVTLCGLENGLRDWVDSLKLDHSLGLEVDLD